jgi:hypothetical protein
VNAIYLRRRLRVILPDAAGETPLPVVMTMQRNLEALGFLLSAEVIEALRATDPEPVASFYRQLVKDLLPMVSAHRELKPIYPGFPAQVMSMSDAELYLRAVLHYLTLERPQLPAVARPPLVDAPPCRVIGVGTRQELDALFTLVARSVQPFSPQDVEDVVAFVTQHREGIRRLLPDEVTCKENLATLGAALLKNAPGLAGWVEAQLTTATDALRLAVAVAGGDVSLAAPCRFPSFPRRLRALLLGVVERSASRAEDMRRFGPRWIRLGERLHPGELRKRFPKAAAAFDDLRRGAPVPTVNGAVEAAFVRGEPAAALTRLAPRPGELTRRLDHLLRAGADTADVIGEFSHSAHRVSTPVLLQAMAHFRHREAATDLRVFFPKGSVAKVWGTHDSRPPLAPGAAAALAEACATALVDRFAALPPLGACWVDPRLADFPVPFARRSAAKALRTLVRGSRVPLPSSDTLRFFVWWRNGDSRVDIDLSAAMFGPGFQYLTVLSYYNLKSMGGAHSGDIVDAPQGAAEFIDVSVERCRAAGARYVVMCLHNFTMQANCDLPECFAGWMARARPDSGEVFEPRTVVDRIDVAANTRLCLPIFFDLETREAIWADVALSSNPRYVNNVAGNLRGVSLMLRAMTGLRRPTLRDLFDLHTQARGTPTATREQATEVFALDGTVTPFDLDRIQADFMR